MNPMPTIYSGTETATGAAGTGWVSALLLLAFAILVAVLLRYALKAGSRALSLDGGRSEPEHD